MADEKTSADDPKKTPKASAAKETAAKPAASQPAASGSADNKPPMRAGLVYREPMTTTPPEPIKASVGIIAFSAFALIAAGIFLFVDGSPETEKVATLIDEAAAAEPEVEAPVAETPDATTAEAPSAETPAAAAPTETAPAAPTETEAAQATAEPAPEASNEAAESDAAQEEAAADALTAQPTPEEAPAPAPAEASVAEAEEAAAEETQAAVEERAATTATRNAAATATATTAAAAGAAAIAASADTGKIINEIEALRSLFKSETSALGAAVAETKELSTQQATRITELRQSFEAAIEERDQRADAQINELKGQLAKIENSANSPVAKGAAASLALLAVQRAVDAGAPFTEQLAVLSNLAPEGADLGALTATAKTGVPTLASLKTKFVETVRQALAAAPDDDDGSFAARLRNLVSVRPATPQPGDEPAAVVSRAEAALQSDDLATATKELSSLDGAAAEMFSGWLGDAQKRLNAATAIDTLNAALLAAYQSE
ncbi:MAG: mitofilin family membrane protein [Pseudomonadota bacterium]